MLVSVYSIKSTGKSVLKNFYDLYNHFGLNIPLYSTLNNLQGPDNLVRSDNLEISDNLERPDNYFLFNNINTEYLVCVESHVNILDICQKFNYICVQLVDMNVEPSSYNNMYKIVSYESDGLTSYKLVEI